MSSKWKTRLASVFVIAFLAALLGPVTAFASPTDVDDPPKGVTQESTTLLATTEAEEPSAQAYVTVAEPNETSATTIEKKTSETKATTDESGEKPAVDATNTSSVDESKTTEQPKVETAQPTTTEQPKTDEQPKVEAAQPTTSVKATEDATTQDDANSGYAGENVTWTYDESTKTLTIKLVNPNDTNHSMWDFPYVDDWDSEHSHPTMVSDSIAAQVTAIDFDPNITSLVIGANAFKNFTSLTSVNWSQIGMIKAIGVSAFEGCTSLRNLAIMRGVETIGAYAFKGCMDLYQVNLPNTLKSIGEGAFDDCPALDSVVFNGTSAQWKNVQLPENPGYVLTNVQTTDSFTITFHPYPETNPTDTFTRKTGTDNRVIDFPEDPTLDGKTFVGWYTAPDGGVRVTYNYAFTGNGDAYGRWTDGEKKYTVTFSNDGVTFATMTTTDGQLSEIPTPTAKVGYTFDGWYTVAGETGGEKITTNSSFEKNTTVYARWVKTSGWAITFNANGGFFDADTTPYSITTVYTGETNKLSQGEFPPNPTQAAHRFDGWWTEPQDTGDNPVNNGQRVDTNFVFTGDTVVYAHWTALATLDIKYTITLDANGGTLASAATLTTDTNGKILSAPNNPTRNGYTFDGWFTAATNGTKISITAYTFTANTTLYAHWTKSSTSNSGTSTTNPSNPTTTNPSGSNTSNPSSSGSSASNGSSSSGTSTTKPSNTSNPTNSGSSTSNGSTTTTTYKVTSGASSTYTASSGKSLTIRANGDFYKFTGLKVDGKTISSPADYTAVSGSTIATLKPAYLNTLSAGKHTLTFEYSDGTASTNFTVKSAPSSPDEEIDQSDGPTDDGPVEGVVEDEGGSPASGPSDEPTSATADEAQSAAVQQRTSSDTDNPDTGDGSMAALWLLAMGATLMCLRRILKARMDA